MAKNKEIIKFTPEQLKNWEEYRDILYKQKTKSDDHFEKAITFIASGALGLTLTFHDKIVPIDNAKVVIVIAIGWALLVATLFVNVYSHYQASKSIDASVDDVDSVIDYQITYEQFKGKLNKRNSLINILNKSSIYSLGTGLILIIIYVSINIHYGKARKIETTVETTRSTTSSNTKSKSERTNDTTTYVPIK